MSGQFLTAEERFDRLCTDKGWMNMSELELLSLDVISDLRAEIEAAMEDTRTAEYERDDWESRAEWAETRIEELERDNEMLHELSGEADETTQDDEVEFLKRLVRDLEDELAAIDAEAVA